MSLDDLWSNFPVFSLFLFYFIFFAAHTVKCEDFFCVTGCPNNEKIDVELSSYGGRNASLPAPEQETRR